MCSGVYSEVYIIIGVEKHQGEQKEVVQLKKKSEGAGGGVRGGGQTADDGWGREVCRPQHPADRNNTGEAQCRGGRAENQLGSCVQQHPEASPARHAVTGAWMTFG